MRSCWDDGDFRCVCPAHCSARGVWRGPSGPGHRMGSRDFDRLVQVQEAPPQPGGQGLISADGRSELVTFSVPGPAARVSQDLHAVAAVQAAHPDLVVSRMTKTLRPGKVLIDWSQNNAAKTTVAPYSLRAMPRPTVSTPVTWAEVESCTSPSDLSFTSDDVLERVAEHGDLLASLAS